MTTMAMVAASTGGPEVLAWREVSLSKVGPGDVAIRHRAIGVNFIDAYFRKGLYPWPSSTWIPGAEACGEIVAVGSEVSGWTVGDRVAYVAATGAYATERVLAADRLVRVPEGIADDVAAACLLKGLTVQCLVSSTYAVRPGHIVLAHAAAGGVGLLLGPWLAHLGATAIGVVGSEAKVDAARRAGYDQVLVRGEGGFADAVRELTVGEGCDVVYDSVGADTWRESLRCLKRFGTFVSFGQSSGPIQGFAMSDLAKGSLTAVRPTLFDYIATPGELAERAAALFALLADGTLAAGLGTVRHARLQDAADVHRALESRATTGATVLIP